MRERAPRTPWSVKMEGRKCSKHWSISSPAACGEHPMLEQSIPEGLHPFVWFPGWKCPGRQAGIFFSLSAFVPLKHGHFMAAPITQFTIPMMIFHPPNDFPHSYRCPPPTAIPHPFVLSHPQCTSPKCSEEGPGPAALMAISTRLLHSHDVSLGLVSHGDWGNLRLSCSQHQERQRICCWSVEGLHPGEMLRDR